MTVMCFVRQLRLQKALELLETTDISVQKIAEMVGYEDVSYFIGQFKKRYRNTPLQMRKKKFLK